MPEDTPLLSPSERGQKLTRLLDKTLNHLLATLDTHDPLKPAKPAMIGAVMDLFRWARLDGQTLINLPNPTSSNGSTTIRALPSFDDFGAIGAIVAASEAAVETTRRRTHELPSFSDNEDLKSYLALPFKC